MAKVSIDSYISIYSVICILLSHSQGNITAKATAGHHLKWHDIMYLVEASNRLGR